MEAQMIERLRVGGTRGHWSLYRPPPKTLPTIRWVKEVLRQNKY